MNIMAEKDSKIFGPIKAALHVDKNKAQKVFNNFNQNLITRLWAKKIDKASKKIKKECPLKKLR